MKFPLYSLKILNKCKFTLDKCSSINSEELISFYQFIEILKLIAEENKLGGKGYKEINSSLFESLGMSKKDISLIKKLSGYRNKLLHQLVEYDLYISKLNKDLSNLKYICDKVLKSINSSIEGDYASKRKSSYFDDL